MEPELIMEKVAKASGANYNFHKESSKFQDSGPQAPVVSLPRGGEFLVPLGSQSGRGRVRDRCHPAVEGAPRAEHHRRFYPGPVPLSGSLRSKSGQEQGVVAEPGCPCSKRPKLSSP